MFSEYNFSEIKDTISEKQIDEYPEIADCLEIDSRKSVRELGKRLRKKYNLHQQEIKRIASLKSIENNYYNNKEIVYIAGIDEVGRGPLAGPVVSAALILNSDSSILHVNDSKKVSQCRREELYNKIIDECVAYSFGVVNSCRIDEINILNATKESMILAVENLQIKPDMVLIDAIKLNTDIYQESIIKGDEKCYSIAAASILAKVYRDKMMVSYHHQYPGYDFDNNKGYGTQKHYEGIKKNGLCPIHRKTFLKEYI
jgi:ribonuclease HII